MTSFEERKKIAEGILFGGTMMLMTKPLKKETLRNRNVGERCVGYQFEIDNLSYRGIWVSTIEDIRIVVDGEHVDKSDIQLCINEFKLLIDQLQSHTEIFWGIEDTCYITVNKVGGLTKGEHKVAVEIVKRPDFGHSYGEAEEGYELAEEYLNPAVIKDEAIYRI